MSALSRLKSPEAKSEVKLITLYNADLPASQSQQSFRVQPNTTVFDLINHLKKIYQNSEIQLFIQRNQLFQGNLNTFLYPILQQYNIRTIQFKVIGENPLLQTSTNKKPYTSDTNQMKSQYNYANQNISQQQSQIEQQNQSQLSNQTNQHEKMIPEISLPSYSQANPQQIQQLKEENVYLQKQLTSEKQQNLDLLKQIASIKQQVDEYLKQQQQKILNEQEQKLQQSQREYSEQIKQLMAQLEREKFEKEQLVKQIAELKKNNYQLARTPALDRPSVLAKEPSPLVESPLKSSFFEKGGISSYHSIDPRLSSTAYNGTIFQLFKIKVEFYFNQIALIGYKKMSQKNNQQVLCIIKQQQLVKNAVSQQALEFVDNWDKLDRLIQIINVNQIYNKSKNIYQKKETIICNVVTEVVGFFASILLIYRRGMDFVLNAYNIQFNQETAKPIARSSINPGSAKTNDYMQNIQSAYGIENQNGVVVSYNSKNNIRIQDVTPAPMQYPSAYNPNFRYINQVRK